MNILTQFEAFYKKYQPGLIHFATYYLSSREDATEVVNDVFVELWNKKQKLKFDDSLKSYAYSSTKNRCFNILRKNRIDTVPELPNDFISSNNPEQTIAAKERQVEISLLINKLPPRCQKIFILSRLDELSHKEIADLLDISTKTIENQITKALKFLKNNLKNDRG